MKRKVTDMIVIHCSATALGRDLGAADIDEMHRAKGWREIGYAQVIKRDGQIEFGRHYDDQGAHVKGHNKHTVGVCLIGGLVANGDAGKEFFDTFNRSQEASLIETIKFLKLAYPGAKILGHRDLSPDLDGDGIIEEHEWLKECPTFSVREWIQEHDL
jgi:hypothetical protein